MISKQDLWPKEGKLKKSLIILGIVIVAALAITLIEEKSGIKLSRKTSMAVAFLCIGVWVYNPVKKEKA